MPVKPVYLPLVHQLINYLARYEQTPSWMTVGQVVDLASTSAKSAPTDHRARRTGTAAPQRAGSPGLLELSEQGIYEVRAAGAASGRPQAIAVNINPVEADLTALDPKELVATVTGHANQRRRRTETAGRTVSREDTERRQGLWWYLLFAGLLLLAAETVVSNRLSQREISVGPALPAQMLS